MSISSLRGSEATEAASEAKQEAISKKRLLRPFGARNDRLAIRLYILTFLLFIFCNFCFAQEDFTYASKGKRNPFIPLVDKEGRLMRLDKEEEKGKTDLLVDGIIYDKQGVSYALVNGRVAGVGDYAGEYRVLRIENDKVIFLKDGQMREVSIINKGGEIEKTKNI